MNRERLQNYVGNGEAVQPTFSPAEMKRRQDAVRGVMRELNVDTALFTSYHNICYLSDFLFCYFGRRFGLMIDHNVSTTVSAGIDGGQPWRRTYGGKNVTYTDWQKDNYFHAVRGLTKGVKRLGMEFDHVNLDTMALLKSEFPLMEFVDIAQPAMRLRMVKSEEEIAVHSTATMVREIAKTWPHGELMDTSTWFQSGINTDGASMEPMITIPNHLPGAGGYREHDILVITTVGNRNITTYPYGPEHMFIGA